MKKSKAFEYTEDEVKLSIARDNLDLAKEYLRGAEKFAQDTKFFRGVVDIAYNSAELAAKGLLSLRMDSLPSTHSGIVRKFSEIYIKSGLVDRGYGKKINRGLEWRNKARYDKEADITKEKSDQSIKLAKELISLLEDQIGKNSS